MYFAVYYQEAIAATGTYSDTYRKVDGEWRIASRYSSSWIGRLDAMKSVTLHEWAVDFAATAASRRPARHRRLPCR